MQIKYNNHEELYYNSTNIEDLNLDDKKGTKTIGSFKIIEKA